MGAGGLIVTLRRTLLFKTANQCSRPRSSPPSFLGDQIKLKIQLRKPLTEGVLASLSDRVLIVFH